MPTPTTLTGQPLRIRTFRIDQATYFSCVSRVVPGDILSMMTRGQSESKVLTIREKILLDGESDWVKLQQVHDYVASENRSESLAEVQRKTLALVRTMAEEGVIALGEPIEHGARFKDWDISLDAAIARLAAEYVDRFDDHLRWPLMLWFQVTDKGKEIGRTYEPECAAWLADLRAQGREYEPLPLHLVPGGHKQQGAVINTVDRE